MSNQKQNKERERRLVNLFKSAYKGFPSGKILADEKQERPDVIVLNASGKIGIEVTAIYNDKLKRIESECEKAIDEARSIYEKLGLPKLHVSVHIGGESMLGKKNRSKFATAIANLVATNIPTTKSYIELENDWNNYKNFPYEINSIYIFRPSSLKRNHWVVPSAGIYREDFISELQKIITEKESKLRGYTHDCKQQWLLIIAENSSPSTFFDPSERTVNHCYASSFDKIFLLKSFMEKLFELKSNSVHSVNPI